MKIDLTKTPKSRGYYFPAEWEKHEATWLSWPHREASWPGKINDIFAPYVRFIKTIAEGEKVRINVQDEKMKSFALEHLSRAKIHTRNIEFYYHRTDDAWCRDHGPAFLINPGAKKKKAIVDWGFNAWGEKHESFFLDNTIPEKISEELGLPLFRPEIIMEGGAVDFNGKGTVITSRSCLLNPNRNKGLNEKEIEFFLKEYYGVRQIFWVEDGIVGDDTDGHIDDMVRFVNENTVLAAVEENKEDENYFILQENLKLLEKMFFLDGTPLNIVKLPMPDPVYYNGERLPASYANFYICNSAVVVPTYSCRKDREAMEIIRKCFPDRKIVGIDSTDIIWGLGSFHCLSQQEPLVL
ncbi:MAG: agmatine deiminase family protein [Bergeyella sp.]|nr:agmatine deiminase family protein [Bergeyella sp.]